MNRSRPLSPVRAKVVEQLVLTIQSSGARKVAFAAVTPDPGAAALAADVAETSARAGFATLLVDLTGAADGPGWVPGETEPEPVRDAEGHFADVLVVDPGEEARAACNNPIRLAAILDHLRQRYDLVIVQVAGLLEERPDRINAVAGAVASDGVVLYCPTAQVTTADAERAVALVQGAGGRIAGTVLDDRANPRLADDVAASLCRTLRFAPRLAAALGNRVRRLRLLQTPLYP